MAEKQTAQDAVSAAMSAIEDALKLSVEEARLKAGASPGAGSGSTAAPAAAALKPTQAAPASAAKAPLGRDRGEPRAHVPPPRPEDASQALREGRPPANDDRAAIGPIVQALRSRRLSRAPFVVAAVTAVVWLALCTAYGALHYPVTGMNQGAAIDYAMRPDTVLLVLAALGPTFILFGFAALARRMQELRVSAGSIALVALRLAEPETAASEQVGTLAQAIRREIASMSDGVERALARAAELETLVRSEVSTLERASSDNERRIRSLIAEMADQRETVVGAGDRLRVVAGEAHRGIADDLEVIAQRLGERIAAQGALVQESLSAAGADVAARLAEAGLALGRDFEGQSNGLIDRVEATGRRLAETVFADGDGLVSRLDDAAERLHETIAVRGQALEDALATSVERMDSSLNARTEDARAVLDAAGATWSEHIEARHTQLRDFFDESTGSLNNQIEKLGEQLNSLSGLVADGGDSVVQRIGGYAARLTDNFGGHIEAVDTIMSNRQAELDERLTDHRARFEEAFATRLAEFDSSAAAHQTDVELALTTHASAVNDAFSDGVKNFEAALGQHADDLVSQIDGKQSAIEETIVVRGGALDERLGQRAEDLVSQIGGKLSAIEEAIVVRGGALDERLGQRSQESAALFESKLQAVDDRANEKLQEIAASLEGLLARIDSGLSARGKALNETLAKNTVEVAKSLNDGGRDAMQGISQSVDRFRDEIVAPLQTLSTQFDGTTKAQSEAVAANLAAATEQLDAILTGRGDQIINELTARIEDLRAVVGSPSTAEFVAKLTEHAAQVSNQIASASEQAEQSFELQTSNLIALMTRRGGDLLAAIETNAADPVRTLGALIGQLSAEVEQSGVALRDAVERNAGQSVRALTSTGDRLRDELNEVLDRLSQTSAALDRAVGGAGDSLGAVQGDLGQKIDEMRSALGAITAQVTELGRVSTTTQSESGALVERMATYTAALAELSRDLAAKQQTIDLALERRQVGLQSLFADIDAKSEEFEAAAARFAASFEESFDRAQARAQEIGAALASTTKGTASTVVTQFEMIRDHAGKERERTSQALQEAYEQANAQLSEVMNETAERFRQSVAEVRQMASEVQRQLDATRQELHRGVFELPEQTSEATTAMRRVVSDQIKALRELTAVVTASGADFDVAEPVAPTARLEPTRSAPAPRIADTKRDDDGRLLIASSVAAEPARSGARPARPRAPQAPDSAPPTAPSTAERAHSGWLSNLLAAASRDETPAAPDRPAGDTVDGISLDIAKFVDAEAAAEMWDRWRSGDTTAVTRRLYTANGQQTFDEVRRRYRSDPKFQASVTRYTQEFERLLAKIGQSDRDGTQSRATLLSDTGKVYTMLAHASGRLG